MCLRNTTARWGAVSMFFHWGVLGLFVAQYLIAEAMEEAMAPEKYELIGLHKSIGIGLLAVVALRLVWRAINPVPMPAKASMAETWLARLVHLGLYVVMIGLPVSGYVMAMAGGYGISFFGLFDIPNFMAVNKGLAHTAEEVHEALWSVTMGLVVLHMVGAVYHEAVKKDTVFRRMLPFTKIGA